MIPAMADAGRFAANHLWQSTLTGCVALALVFLLRKGEARLRHAIWMAASMKFLVPFAALVALGEGLGMRHVLSTPATPMLDKVLVVGQPFAPSHAIPHAVHGQGFHVPWLVIAALVWAMGAAGVVIAWVVRWRRVRAITRAAEPRHTGREADALRAACDCAGLRRQVPLLVSDHCIEPGVFGILRPVLLWPAGISAHLDDEQLAAIVTHEVSHVRRRDNLLALLHMCVEAMFWFHPLVWWMGARLLEERERACDEAVLRLGNEPARYADAILKACRFCVESPLPCVAGVSGSDLKKRMVRIMNAATIPLSRSRKMLLAMVALAAIAGPVGMGMLTPRVVKADEAQKFANLRFDSASLTPTQGGDSSFFVMVQNNEFSYKNATMKNLIATAYGVKPDRIVGGPEWIDSQRFDFEARWTPTPEATSTIAPPPAPRTESQMAMFTATNGGGAGHPLRSGQVPAPAAVQAMLRNFLAERVGLRMRSDSEVLPVYELVVANGGSKLTPTHQEQPSDVTRVEMQTRLEAHVQNGNQSFAITNGDPRVLCDRLSDELGHQVLNKTGLTGRYDFEISFPAHADADQVAAILRDQYGLDLQSSQQPVKVFAIDNINMPQAN